MNGNPTSPHETVLLDTRALAMRCMKLDRAFQTQVQRTESLEKQLQQIESERTASAALRQIGLQELQRVQKDTQSKLRAIVQHTGETSRIHAYESLLGSEHPNPEQMQRLHAEVSAEFNTMYPSQPRSQDAHRSSHLTNRNHWNAFQLTPGVAR